jgi:hypothetical protein
MNKLPFFIFLVLIGVGCSETSAPTASPSTGNETHVPTIAPTKSNVTSSPAPSVPPSASNYTAEPTTAMPTTVVPQPTPAPSGKTVAPTPATEAPTRHESPSPTASPTQSPSAAPSQPSSQNSSIGKIIAKTIGWLILIALSVLVFGAMMSNRYQIYYALRGVWYTMLQMECTRWIMSKLNFRGAGGGGGPTGSLNEIIFDNNDLTEGLLMGDT